MNHICLSINQLMDIWVVSIFLFTIMKNATMNIRVKVFIWTCFQGPNRGVKLLGPMVTLCLTF